MRANGECVLKVLDVTERHITLYLHRRECAHPLWEVLVTATSYELIPGRRKFQSISLSVQFLLIPFYLQAVQIL
jgi:hypothetical protein